MVRATTPKHSFLFDVDPETTFEKILITYYQNGEVVLEKGKEDLEYEETTDCCGEKKYVASCRLTQNETKKFTADDKSNVRVQVRVLTTDGVAMASDEKRISVKDVLNDEVL